MLPGRQHTAAAHTDQPGAAAVLSPPCYCLLAAKPACTQSPGRPSTSSLPASTAGTTTSPGAPDVWVLVLAELAPQRILHHVQQHGVVARQRVLLAALALAVRGLLLARVAAQPKGQTLGRLRVWEWMIVIRPEGKEALVQCGPATEGVCMGGCPPSSAVSRTANMPLA